VQLSTVRIPSRLQIAPPFVAVLFLSVTFLRVRQRDGDYALI
jgi:hypothetical protein